MTRPTTYWRPGAFLSNPSRREVKAALAAAR